MPPESQVKILAQSATADGFVFQHRKDSEGVLDVPGLDRVLLSVHLGAPALMSCRRDGRQFRGTAVHGDMDIIPAQTPARWQMHDANDASLLLVLPESTLRAAANELELNGAQLEMRNRFQVRDRELESLSWAIKREMELNFPSGRLYLEGLTAALASRLVTQHSSLAKELSSAGQQLGGHRLKRVLSFIEENLGEDLSLSQVAAIAGVGATHIKATFRKATGLSVHQYVIQRRVERAKALLMHDHLSMVEIAQQAGFAHQSHMARHMQRLMGVPPRVMKRLLQEASSAT